MPGLEANIQPEKTGSGGRCGRLSTICRKAACSGGSSGGLLRQVRTVIARVPKATVWSMPTSNCRTRAVTLSRPCSTAAVPCSDSAAAGQANPAASRAAASLTPAPP